MCYLVHLSLRGLLQGVQDDVQVLLKLSSDGQRDVTECREDLRLHRPMDVLILNTHTEDHVTWRESRETWTVKVEERNKRQF